MSGARERGPAFSAVDILLVVTVAILIVTVAAFLGWL